MYELYGLTEDINALFDEQMQTAEGAMEPGGIVLVRAKDTWSDHDDADNQKESPKEALIQVQVDLQQTP